MGTVIALHKFKHVHLYNEPSAKTLKMDEIAAYLKNIIKCDIDVRPEFFTHFLEKKNIDRIAEQIASRKVFDPRKPFSKHEPMPIEIQFEKKVLSNPDKRFLGILYDGFEMQQIMDEIIPEQENTLEHVHMVFTNRLICTYSEDDFRYHYRTIICGYPTIVCTSGIVEAPAKPREFYIMQQYYAALGNMNLEEIKKRFEGRFIDYDDPRMTEIAKGLVLQGLFYYISGNPFCEKKDCRLLNAHWQEDMIVSQLNNGKLCDDHLKILHNFNSSKP